MILSLILPLALPVALPLATTAGPTGVQTARPQEAFPASTPIAEGLSPKGVADLTDLVQGLVDEGEIVGAELLIIKNGRTVLHGAYGLRDVESETPMEPGGVFCVRSMTKPLVGTAIAMLVEDKKLKLSDRASKYLPSFDVDSTREITLEQLLQHTSGLPMSMIMAADPRKLKSLRGVADLGGGAKLDFEPGSAFQYSDQGTDTLTAIIEAVTGAPAETFIKSRILAPLGMDSSACIFAEDDPLRERACSAYAGQPGSWSRFWSPEEPPLFPVFLGSQGLYSTAVDYARFLEMWMRRGRGPEGRILKSSSVRRTLRPGPHPLGASTALPELRVDYGSLMQLWTRAEEGSDKREVVAFGHTGSDGTHAWAFPKEKAMVLYFTQSRGTMSGLQVEEQLGSLLLGVPFDPIEAAPPLEPYLGYYFEGEGDRYRSIVRDGNGIALEILGKALVPLVYAGGDRWKLKPQPGTVLEFDRSDAGEVTGYHIGDHQEFRFEPAADLPTADEVAARIAATHRVDLLESAGGLRMDVVVSLAKLGLEGERTAWIAWPDRWRVDETIGDQSALVAFDGEVVRMSTAGKAAEIVEGRAAELMQMNGLRQRFGDWRLRGQTAQVIQRIAKGGDGDSDDGNGSVLLVRLGDTSGFAPTYYVSEERWVVGRIDGMTEIPGMGMIGQELEFGDFREVAGMLLPYRVEVELANPMIGKIVSLVTKMTTGQEFEDDWFRL